MRLIRASFFILSILCMNLSLAKEVECISDYLSKLTKSEAHIRSLHQNTFDLFLNCPYNESDIATATHESSHLIDTGIPFSIIKIYLVQHEKRFPRFNGILGFAIHRPKGVVYEIPFVELPAAQKVFDSMKFQDTEYKKLLSETRFSDYFDLYFQSWVKGRMNTNLSSYSFSYGFPMEINGYLYGARSELDHSMKDTSDLSGLLYFIASTEMYVKGLKRFDPRAFDSLIKSNELKIAFTVLMKEAIGLIREEASQKRIKEDPDLSKIMEFVFDENHIVYLNYILNEEDKDFFK